MRQATQLQRQQTSSHQSQPARSDWTGHAFTYSVGHDHGSYLTVKLLTHPLTLVGQAHRELDRKLEDNIVVLAFIMQA